MSTLDILCNAFGWQGGTIHAVKAEFATSPIQVKDAICTDLMRAIDSKELKDITTALEFFKLRNGQL